MLENLFIYLTEIIYLHKLFVMLHKHRQSLTRWSLFTWANMGHFFPPSVFLTASCIVPLCEPQASI